jgi:anti-sigma B factor antagonist
MNGRTVVSSAYLIIVTEHHGRRSVLSLRGELDVGNKDLLADAIGSALERGARMLVVDLSALDFMDCSGLSVLVETRKQLADGRGQLVITGSQPIVRRLFHLMDLDHYLDPGPPDGGPRAGAEGSTPPPGAHS